MIDVLKTIRICNREYPYICTLGSLEKMQIKYGSITDWNKKLVGAGEGDRPGFNPEVALSTFHNLLKEGKAAAEMLDEEAPETPEIDKLPVMLAISKVGLIELCNLVQDAVTFCINPNQKTPTPETVETGQS